MQHRFRATLKKALAFTAGVAALFALSALSVAAVGATKAYAATDCDDNAVMFCGFSSKSGLISTTKSGDQKGHKDLAAIYNAFGLSSADYNRFISSAQPATFYKDGRVVVNGQTVATNAVSYGRLQSYHSGTGMVTKTVGGTTLYGNATSRTFASDSISGYVLFDATGTPQFMVIGSCGNPVTGKLVNSGIACKLLNASPVSGRTDSFDFTGSANATGLDKITKYVLDYGDGNSKTITTANGSTGTLNHVYDTAGTYTAKLTVYGTGPGGSITIAPAGSCVTPVTVKKPFYQCVQLGGNILDQSKYSYRFIATMKYGDGAQFTSADFDFGDGKSMTGVKAADATTVFADHTYAKAGTYSASAILHFLVNGQPKTADTCYAVVTPTTPPTPECKPGVPVGDVRCEVCKYDASLQPGDARCVPPITTLPNTGAGNVIAVGAIALIGGFLVYRHRLFKRHKAAYVAADLGVSPLPLGQPLNDQPLAGTPMQPAKKSFLRRRQY